MATINDYSAAYEAAKKIGNTAGMESAHASADALRGSPTTTKVVNGNYEQVPTWLTNAPRVQPAVQPATQQAPVNQWTAAEKARLKAIEATKQGTLDALKRSGVEAQNQYNTGSAMLGGQTQTGRRSLAEYLSQRGLTGSGIGAQGEINAIGNLQQGLGGLEATREGTLANIQAQRVDAENQALSQQADLAGVQEQRQIDAQATALAQDIAQIQAEAYNQDIQAEINRRMAINPNDPTIPYLQAQRNAKLGGMATSAAEQAQQEFDNAIALEKLGISRYNAYKTSGSSSSGSSSSGSSSNTSTKKAATTKTTAKTAAPTAAYLALDAQLPNTKDEYKITGIQSAYNKGIISEAEANQLLTKYGLQ